MRDGRPNELLEETVLSFNRQDVQSGAVDASCVWLSPPFEAFPSQDPLMSGTEFFIYGVLHF